MLRKPLILLLFLPFLLFADNSLQQHLSHHVSFDRTPLWVTEPNFSLEPESTHPSQVNEQTLLLDTQIHLDEKAHFFRRATKILTKTGVENLSQLRFSFDPSYQKLVVHTIQVYRGGKWSDRMSTSTSKILQRERDLDQNLYDGNLSLVYFLNDLQAGDVLEYSCSFIGEHPIFSSHFARVFSLQEENSIEKIHYRLLGSPYRELQIQPFYTDLEPKITALSPTLKEWVWESLSTPPCQREPYTPSWHDIRAQIHVSQYQNWGELARQIAPFYALPPDSIASCPIEALQMVEQWKNTTDDPTEQATLALRFVQDSIWYQGFEDGEGAFKPTDPWVVYGRRFGDCKDKVYLLRMLLKLLDIESVPLLVHTTNGKHLPNALPSPFYFNHVVLKIDIQGNAYWVDPTMSLQGGSLIDNQFPSYYWGLPLSEKSDDLIQLPEDTLKKPIEMETNITVTSRDTIDLSIKKTCFYGKADKYRRYLESIGLQRFAEENLTSLKRKYGTVSASSSPLVTDNRQTNTLEIQETYTITLKAGKVKKIIKIPSFIIDACLDDNITMNRSSPYALYYPMWIREHITITNPFGDWNSEEDSFKIEIPSIFYQYSYSADKNTIDIQHEIRHLQDHLPTELVDEYWYAVDEIKSRNVDKVHLFSKELP